MKSKAIHRLRVIALTEGVSFLVLLFIAMPMKYFAHMDWAVQIVGWIHGILFIVFCFALLAAMMAARWHIGRAAMVFIAALLPFGPFIIDHRLKDEEVGGVGDSASA